jgi:hypothetical protein
MPQSTQEKTMSEFTFLFRGNHFDTLSPAEMQKYTQSWMGWMKAHGLSPNGHPLEPVGKVVKGKEKAMHDGPYAEAKDLINGFLIVEAADLAQAFEIAHACPILDLGGSVEVRPIRVLNQ